MPDIFDQLNPQPLQGAKPTPSKGLKFNDSSAAGSPQGSNDSDDSTPPPTGPTQKGDIFDQLNPNQDIFEKLNPSDAYYRQLYAQQKNQGAGDVLGGIGKGIGALKNTVTGTAGELGSTFGQAEAAAEQGQDPWQTEAARRQRASLLEGVAQTGRNYLNYLKNPADRISDMVDSFTRSKGNIPVAIADAVSGPGGMVHGLLKNAGAISSTPEQDEADYQAWKKIQMDKEQQAKTPAAPEALQQLWSGGAEPLPETTGAISMVSDPLNYLSLGGAPAAQALRKVEAGMNVASAAEKAAATAGNVMKGAGHVLEATGELPETLAQKITEGALGPQAGEAARKLGASVGPVSAVTAAIHGGAPETVMAALEGAKRVGKAAQGVGEATTALAEADRNNPFGRLNALAKDPDAPEWMRYAASSNLVKAGASAAGAVKDVAAGALHGAATGAVLGAANAQSPEEFGESVGQMGAIGAGLRAATLPAQNRARVMQKMANAAAELYGQHIAEGISPDTMKKIGDSTMMTAAAAQKMFGDVRIRFLDGENGQFADQATKSDASPHSAGFWDPTARTIYLNADSGRGADTTLLHELTHPLFDSVVANRPELKAQIDSSLQQTGKTLDQAKRDYVEQIVGQKGFTNLDEYSRAVSQYIDRMDKGSAAIHNDPNHWIYSELMAEAGMKAMKGKNLVTDIVDPSLTTRAVQASKGLLEGLGVKFKEGQDGKTILPNFEDTITSPGLRKSTYSLLRAMKDYRPGIDEPAQQGVAVTPETMGQHPGAPVHVLPNGELGNDFMAQSASGKVVPRPNKDIRKIVRSRRAEVNAAYPLPQTEAPTTQDPKLQWRKTPSGLSERSGTTLGPDFDKLRTISDDTKAKAKDLEQAMQDGTARQGWYQQIGEGPDWRGSVSRDTGNVTAQHKQFLPINFHVDKAGNILVRNYSLGAFNDKAQVWAGRRGPLSLELWDGNVKEFKDDVAKYLDNHKNNLSGDTGIGEQKKNVINAFLVGKNVTWEKANPLRASMRGSDTQGVVRSYRLDRLETLAPHETEMAQPDYAKQVKNLSPEPAPELHSEHVNMSPDNGDPRAIRAAAVVDKDSGKMYEGPMHWLAYQEMLKDKRNPAELIGHKEGFVDNAGNFLDRNQAYARAEEMKQLKDLKPNVTDRARQLVSERTAMSPDQTKKPTVMVKGPDGTEHPFTYDGEADWGKFGKFHQLTAQEDVPGLTVKNSSLTDKTLNKAGYTFELPKPVDASAEKQLSNPGNVTHEAVMHSPDPDYEPKKTVKGYELFRAKDGKLYPLFVDRAKEVPMGEWQKAEDTQAYKDPETGKMRVKSSLGDLAYRPGWHAGDLPYASHIGVKDKNGKIVARRANEVWAEVEMPADKNYQDEANKNGTRPDGKFVPGEADLDHMPEDGYYRYKTNPNMTGDWMIGGHMKVNRVLPESEVNQILRKNGVKPMPWEGGKLDLKKLGVAQSPDLTPPAGVKPKEFEKNIQIEASDHPEVARQAPHLLPTIVKDELRLDPNAYKGEEAPQKEGILKRLKRGAKEMYDNIPTDLPSLSPDEVRNMPEDKELNRYANRIVSLTNSKGGASFDVTTGKAPTRGFSVSLYPDRTQLAEKGELTPETIKDFAQKNADLLAQPDHVVGTWHDKESGKTYLDVSYVAPNENIAKHAAEMFNQKAYWDIKGGKEVPTGGTGESREDLPPALERAPQALERAPQAKESFEATQQLPQGEIRGPVQVALPEGTDKSKGRVRTVQESQHLDLDAIKNAPDTENYRKKVVEQFRTQPGFRDIDPADTNKALDEINKRVQQNLQFLYDRAKPEDRDLWKQWYDFAHDMSHRWGKEYGLHGDIVAAINARLSPQMEWNNNVTLTRRALDTIKKDPTVTEADKEFLKAKIMKEDTAENPQTTQSKNLMNRQLEALAGMEIGDKMSELDDLQAGMLLRSHNELYAPRSPLHDHNLKRIPGDYLKWSKPFQDFADVMSIYRNPSFENVSNLLGGNHKVRSFYNNHVDPSSPLWTTIDTHATAAANLYPYGGSDKAVVSNFGNPNHKNSGVNGVYPVYQDAYEKVAKANGILPRELQSIVWEQMRKELNPAAKRMVQDAIKKAAEKGTASPAQFEAIWAKAERGEITREEAQKQLTAEFEKWNAKANHGAAAKKRAAAEREGESAAEAERRDRAEGKAPTVIHDAYESGKETYKPSSPDEPF